jgi:hypothetical protein
MPSTENSESESVSVWARAEVGRWTAFLADDDDLLLLELTAALSESPMLLDEFSRSPSFLLKRAVKPFDHLTRLFCSLCDSPSRRGDCGAYGSLTVRGVTIWVEGLDEVDPLIL